MTSNWWYRHTPEALWSWADFKYAVVRWPQLWPFNVEKSTRKDLNWLVMLRDPSWWKYLTEGLGKLPWWSEAGVASKTRRFVCRWRCHPCGYWYYTLDPEAGEPDSRCKNCEEDIG